MKKIPVFVFVVAVFLGIIALGHFVVYEAFIHIWSISFHAALAHLRILTTVLALSFLAITLATSRAYTRIGSWLYTLAAFWLGTVLFLFAASVLGAIALPFFGAMPGKALFVLALLASIYGVINSNATRVTRYEVEIKNLPESWQGKKIGLASDLHLGNVRGKRFAQKIARMLNAENPEIVLLAGDFFDGPAAPFAKFASPMKDITAPRGAYFSEGNHEEFSPSAKYDEALAAAGVHILSNKKVELDGIELIGINYNASNSNEAAAETLAKIGVRKDLPSILIKHAPNGIEAVEAAGIDLQVSGHTHRGQVWPGSLLARRVFGRFEYGKNIQGGLTVITSSGTGTWGPMQRVGTHSEIVIVTLKNK